MTPSKTSALRPPTFALRPKRGFALLITVTLLAFLVLLLVSLSSLTRVETQVASNNQTLAQARLNALMALNIALGQLQKHTGPDQRVTATADVAIPAAISASITATTTGAAARTTLDTYWSASRNRYWTGSWQNTNTTPVNAINSKTPVVYNPVPSPTPAWLVSGNETAATFVPTTAPAGLAFDSDPVDPANTIKGAADTDYPSGRPYRILVGRKTTAANAAADLARFVTAPQVPIRSTNIPGTTGASTTIGNYAWWVGDEGVKARANQIDAHAGDTSVTGNRIRLQSAQRPAIEAMTTNAATVPPASGDSSAVKDAAGLSPFYPANSPTLRSIVTPRQLTYLDTNTVFRDQLDKRYHDLTTSSRGVLADVKNGGLKRDLSYILSQPTPSAFRTALNTTHNGGPAYTPAPLSTYNPALSAVTTPYAAGYPDIINTYFTLTFEGDSTYPGIFAYGPTWEQLWSFFNLGNRTSDTPAGAFNASGTVAVARPVNGNQQGLYPVVVQSKVFYRLRIVGTAIWVDIQPQVVLANPYNVTLSGDYIIKFGAPSGNALRIQASHYEADPVTGDMVFKTPAVDVTGGTASVNGYMGNIDLVVRSTGIPPGEAHIFTLDTDVTIPAAAAAQTTTQAIMVNDLDPSTYLTFDTGKIIPPAETHVILFAGSSTINPQLYVNNDTNTDTRVNVTNTYRFSGSGMVGSGILVDPVSSGVQQGGGFWFTYCDGACLGPQQSPFYQINYRAMLIASAGYTTPNNHPLQWAHSYVRYGVTGSHDPLSPPPNPFFYANLMRPSGSLSSTRWGLINNGDTASADFSVAPASIGGPSSTVGFTGLMYDIPKPGQPLTSLGQLQHFNTAGHLPTGINNGAGTVVHQWQVNYPISNSYPQPRVPRHQVFDLRGDYSYNYDGSYLWNDILWDRFYFSSFPSTGAFDLSTDKLVNARYTPFRATTLVPLNDPAQFRGLFLAAQNLLVDGAFNINSTSVDAWKAVFSSLKNVPIGTDAAGDPTPNANLSAPFARTLGPLGGSTAAKAGNTDNAWKGFRNLTTTEINQLAEEMVLQVQRRGPFLSMGEFVNRRLMVGRPLINPPTTGDPLGLGLSGALQSAIDKVLNKTTDITQAPFNAKTGLPTNNSGYNLIDADYPMPSRISGFPGYLLQADVLSSLGPTLSARSDTFTIRTYGDVQNPATGTVTGRAWCEAIVQRTPDYVDTTAPDAIPAVGSAAETFGRRYQIISFRWLSPSDI